MKRRSLALSRKIFLTVYNKDYPSLMLNDTSVQIVTNGKHLVQILVSRLDLIEYIDNKINKCEKIIGLMKRSSLALSIKIFLKYTKITLH